MNKSDLRTGMRVTLRNCESYYVMLNTGLRGEQENVLIHKIGKDTGWLPLNRYADDMSYHDDDDDDPIFPHDPEYDKCWDIVKVDAVDEAAYLTMVCNYRTVWERKEKSK